MCVCVCVCLCVCVCVCVCVFSFFKGLITGLVGFTGLKTEEGGTPTERAERV